MIEYLQSIGAAELTSGLNAKEVATPGTDFGQWLTQQIQELNQQISVADTGVRQLAVGQGGNLHEVMTQLEQAKIAFELVVQVRNKVLEAYTEIMRMPV